MPKISRLSRLLRIARNDDGNAMLEFGLVLPVLVMLLFGVLAGSLALDRYKERRIKRAEG